MPCRPAATCSSTTCSPPKTRCRPGCGSSYSTAKFAAIGFSEGLRAELGRSPVTVTTVVPGLMRTGSHLNARFTGQAAKEFTWFSLGGSLPLISMDAERAARQIVSAVRGRRAEIILTPAGQVVSRIAGLAPA